MFLSECITSPLIFPPFLIFSASLLDMVCGKWTIYICKVLYVYNKVCHVPIADWIFKVCYTYRFPCLKKHQNKQKTLTGQLESGAYSGPIKLHKVQSHLTQKGCQRHTLDFHEELTRSLWDEYIGILYYPHWFSKLSRLKTSKLAMTHYYFLFTISSVTKSYSTLLSKLLFYLLHLHAHCLRCWPKW